MWNRTAVAAGLAVTLSATAGVAQLSNVTSRAVPPDKAALDRLNLRTEWAVNLPVRSVRESVSLVQTLDDQLFVQTRTGLLTAVDARTGQIQWSADLGTGAGTYANVYPVAANTRFVFAANVTRLFCFHRYTGVTEFVTDMGASPTVGLACDEDRVYMVLSSRGAEGGSGHRIAVYGLPAPISLPEKTVQVDADDPNLSVAIARDRPRSDPARELMARYPGPGVNRTTGDEAPDEISRPPVRDGSVVGGMTGRSPSITTLPSVLPPYSLQGQYRTPSVNILPSMRHPYHLRDQSSRDIQRSPSLGVIPPSIGAAMMLADLRPRGVSPPLVWEYGTTRRVLYPLLVAPVRVWGVGDGGVLAAVSKVDRAREVVARMSGEGSAAPAQGEVVGYVPQSDGYLVAVDLLGGNLTGGANELWRANLGGIMNRTPVVTKDAVYAGGDNGGISRVDRTTGTVLWRSDLGTDRLLAVNQEFAYLRDRQGRLQVYDARRPTDPATRQSRPLSGLDLAAFNVPVTNTVTDRLYLAADNGLLVCLRDASPKYARPMRMAPDVTRDVPRRDPNAPPQAAGMMPVTAPEEPK